MLTISSRASEISYLLIVFGSLLVAAGLELFLLPNQVAMGGVPGVSILAAHVTEMKLSLFLFLLNMPFLFRRTGSGLSMMTLLPVVCITVFTYFLHPYAWLVEEPLLAALGGGIFLGLGVGLILRHGGRFGEAQAVVRKLPFFGEIKFATLLFFINICILLAAGAVFGLEQALYSVLAHSLAFMMVEAGFTGLSGYKRLRVESASLGELRAAVERHCHVQWMPEEEQGAAICIVHRTELAEVRRLIQAVDPDAKVIRVAAWMRGE